jgi:hypothetical protein
MCNILIGFTYNGSFYAQLSGMIKQLKTCTLKGDNMNKYFWVIVLAFLLVNFSYFTNETSAIEKPVKKDLIITPKYLVEPVYVVWLPLK